MNVTLNDIKNALGITGNYQDATLQIYFDEVIAFLTDAGVPESSITSGIVARGVSDLWNYGGAEGKLSAYFVQRAIQLSRPGSSSRPSSGGGGGGGGDLSNYYTKMETDALLLLKANVNDVPTKVSQLQNDSGFITALTNALANYYLKSDTYTKSEVNNLVSVIPKFSIEVVGSLPTEDISNTTVYLLKTAETEGNMYDEYIYVNDSWELLGTQEVDLTGYATEAYVTNAVADKLTEPSQLAVGKYFRVASIDANGHAVLECVDAPTVPVQSVSAAGTALTPDASGNVNIPQGDHNNWGLVKVSKNAKNLGIDLNDGSSYNGFLRLTPVGDAQITARTGFYNYLYGAINTTNFDFAVKAAMTDGKGAAWTDAQRLAALLRMGCTVDENGYVKWTASE